MMALTQTHILLFTLVAMAAPMVGYAFGWLCDMVSATLQIVAYVWIVGTLIDDMTQNAAELQAMADWEQAR